MKPVVPSAKAREDVLEAVDFYRREAGSKIALAFIDELQRAYGLIAERPAAGSLRYSYEVDIPHLRSFAWRRYPHIIFYVDRNDTIDIWRVLHAKRDIPVWMSRSPN